MTLMSVRPSSSAHPPGDVAMAGAVEPPAADAELGRPGVGDGVALVGLGDRPVEAGLERGDQGQLGKPFAEHPHRLDVRRVVGRGDVGEGLHRLEHVLVDQVDAGQVPGVDRLEADGRDFARRLRARRSRGRSTGRGRAARRRRGRRSAGPSRRSPCGDLTTTLAIGEPIRSIAPRASTGSAGSPRSKRRYLKLVLPRLATRIFIAAQPPANARTTTASGPRDDVGGLELADLGRRPRPPPRRRRGRC